ncbi:MAG: hypothetical protein PHX43_02940 [Alphaproteobacteria bacterium]|nr:hypothetical protein [Alphaproteobacteria bacterium]
MLSLKRLFSFKKANAHPAGAVAREKSVSDMACDFSYLSQILSTTTYLPICEKFSCARNIRPQDWDFFVTVVSVYFYIHKLKSSGLSIDEQTEAFTKNCSVFAEKNPRFDLCLNNLLQFLSPKKGDIAAEDIGFWLSANLFNKTADEIKKEELEVGIATTKLVYASL